MKTRRLVFLNKYVVIFILLPIAVLSLLFFKSYWSHVGAYHGVKSVQEGSYFSLTVGSDAALASSKLIEMGLEDITSQVPREDRITCSSTELEGMDDTYMFSDVGLWVGVVCVSIKNGKIIEIHTDYSASMW